jgi:hypothetical protein
VQGTPHVYEGGAVSIFSTHAAWEKLKITATEKDFACPAHSLSFFLSFNMSFYIPPHRRTTVQKAASAAAAFASAAFRKHKQCFAPVLIDVICATHCHGCGDAGLQALNGYHGQYCCKGCWWDEVERDMEEDAECPFGTNCYECGDNPRNLTIIPPMYIQYRRMLAYCNKK